MPDTPAANLHLILRLAALHRRAPHPFALTPDAAARAGLAAELGIRAVKKLEFAGQIAPEGAQGWRLTARLGASVVQDCVVSGAPVPTRIDTDVVRRYVPGLAPPDGAEAEVPDDDTLEPLTAEVDAGDVLREALALALPDYPRALGAELPAPQIGAAETRANPFAALAKLKGDGGE